MHDGADKQAEDEKKNAVKRRGERKFEHGPSGDQPQETLSAACSMRRAKKKKRKGLNHLDTKNSDKMVGIPGPGWLQRSWWWESRIEFRQGSCCGRSILYPVSSGVSLCRNVGECVPLCCQAEIQL